MLSHVSDMREPRVSVGDVPFEVTSLDEATRTVVSLSTAGVGTPIRLANAYCVAMASTDADYSGLLKGPGINFPDGTPVVWFMRAERGLPSRPERVRGPSLFTQVLDVGRQANLRHFFLGTTEDTLLNLVTEANKRFPGIAVAGTYAPPFAPLDSEFYNGASEKINDARADIVWVALGSPKQDYACAELASRCGIPCAGVGAAFDFIAGTAQEAPTWMQANGLEWFFRLMTEPRRLWKRYLFGNARFAYAALRSARRS